MSAPLLQDRISQLADMRLEVEEKQGIHVSSEEVLRLRKVAEEAQRKKQSIIFLPSHRSHVDYVSMQLICYRLGLGLPVVVAGDNLNFPLVGPFLQNAGKHSLPYLLSGRVEDAVICPVSTQYDKVVETEGYVTELLGVPKKKENLADFLNSTSILSLKLGRVDVRFHEPWSLRGYIDAQLTKITKSPKTIDWNAKTPENTALKQKLLRTMGYQVLSDINDVSVVMPTALIGTVLLTLRGRGVGKSELMRRVEWLTARVRAKGGRVAHFGNAPLSDVVERGLEVLGKDLVGVVQGLAEPTYYAVDRFQLSFYRNMTIHLFISEALVSAAMYTRVKMGGGPAHQDISYEAVSDQVLFLSSLFRGEFIFSSEGLAHNLEKTLVGLENDRVINLTRDEQGKIINIGLSDEERLVGRENYDFYCFLIWPFIEASWLAAVSLLGLTPPIDQKDEIWIEVSKAQGTAQGLGKTLYHQGDLSYFEAVNKETLKNSFQRFEEEGILYTIKSKDAKVPPRLRLASEWAAPRDPETGALLASGRLWDFTEKIAASRREGKNRRDGATVSTRVLLLTDTLGAQLFEQAAASDSSKQSPAKLSPEEATLLKRQLKADRKRRKLEGRAHL
ncbi:putative glycerol-3-phosphate acyltransferase protein [Eutypa lata UCREL1]|uniref:Putative glycerol-3-phosphate acyltransferase protein n=1 Tax=Eutypa lata (strain UCR-EL1) TaxID=1287681 RepID=M7SQU6_EUTLA|nr:putative glycerol-3-phosphate acyltransferase protein [Eutypa lata UCREL1]